MGRNPIANIIDVDEYDEATGDFCGCYMEVVDRYGNVLYTCDGDGDAQRWIENNGYTFGRWKHEKRYC